MSNEKKVVIVTGASRGIGEALVEAYRRKDYRVVATARTIKPSGDGDVLTVAGDIGDPATGPRVVAEALERFGRVDTLVNNAGAFVPGPFTKYTRDQYALMLATNLNGFFYVTQAAIEAMEKRGSGHVVSVTTTLGELGNSKVPSALASLTKGGINAATRSLAIEYASRGIRVNAVSPGIIKTPMHSPETYELKATLHPMGRMGEIADIVGAILYLETASFVTGEILHVDGGQSAGR
ncbi:SDR family oxidoreductase [Bradyrhizobium sp. 83002]|uniref:SDR family NAD(P)-dependent oxidoreductase n=1 Tax=Bradyrhizobium aeschynomenes TaxID=2734909 RepID=UPI001553FE2F|nr:SDR family oxidoreductase [Bradyrhizobium aeschynomenes]NPU09695.1 SDR family oxidoreductase [Bradyrhizobium aeschynomenes]